jgi:hypothetical protein
MARIRLVRSAGVTACTQIIGRSGPGVRADAGRTAIQERPWPGSHIAHAGNSRCSMMTSAITCLASVSSPASVWCADASV